MSAARAKGTRFETAIADFLRDVGFPHAERRALNGAKDKGDIAGVLDVVIEAKNQKRESLAEWLDEALTERDNASASIGAVWFKRRGKASAGDGYVLLDGHTFARLLREAGYSA